jgi:hypothetical protein
VGGENRGIMLNAAGIQVAQQVLCGDQEVETRFARWKGVTGVLSSAAMRANVAMAGRM